MVPLPRRDLGSSVSGMGGCLPAVFGSDAAWKCLFGDLLRLALSRRPRLSSTWLAGWNQATVTSTGCCHGQEGNTS